MSLFFFCFIFVLLVANAIIKTPEQHSSGVIQKVKKETYIDSAAEELDQYKANNPELFTKCEEMRNRFNLHIQLMSFSQFEAYNSKIADEAWDSILKITGQTGKEGYIQRTGHELVHSQYNHGSFQENVFCGISYLGSEPHDWEYYRGCKRNVRDWVYKNYNYALPHDYLSLLSCGLCRAGMNVKDSGSNSARRKEEEIAFYKKHDLECLIPEIDNY